MSTFENIYGSIQTEMLAEARVQNLVTVDLPIDELTESVGDINIHVTGSCEAWLKQDDSNRDKLAEALLNLADRIIRE